jgi:hypothetical protein
LADVLAAARAELFFVVGSPRSGTTWLQRALNGHPQISCSGEGHFFEELAPRLAEALKAYGRQVRVRSKASLGDESAFLLLDEPEPLLGLAVLLLMRKNSRPGTRWIGEKTPDNILALDRLAHMFPTARFIHVHRDPRDVCVSAWFNNLRLNRSQTLSRWPDLGSYVPVHARAWANRIIAARRFAGAYPDKYYEVAYEALSTAFEPAFAGVLRFLGAPAESGAVAACREAGGFERSAGRPTGTEDRGSHFRGGERGNWRAHFDASLARTYANIAGAEMRLLGYAA